MTVDQLKRAHQTQPFQPFTLRTADGLTYEVRHPEFMSFSQSGRTIAVATPDDAHDVLDVLLITAIHKISGATGGNGTNGHSERAG